MYSEGNINIWIRYLIYFQCMSFIHKNFYLMLFFTLYLLICIKISCDFTRTCMKMKSARRKVVMHHNLPTLVLCCKAIVGNYSYQMIIVRRNQFFCSTVGNFRLKTLLNQQLCKYLFLLTVSDREISDHISTCAKVFCKIGSRFSEDHFFPQVPAE